MLSLIKGQISPPAPRCRNFKSMRLLEMFFGASVPCVSLVKVPKWFSTTAGSRTTCGAAPYPPKWKPAEPLRNDSTPPPLVTLLPKKSRDVILKVWHTDPLRCPPCQRKMEVRATDSAQKRQTFPSGARGRAVPGATPDTAQCQGDAQFSGIVSSDNANRDSLVLIVEQFAFAKETLQLCGGRICRVGSMADVDHHIHAEITANGAFVSLLGICRTKQVANVRNGVFTLQRECNHRSLLHEILDLRKERLFRDMRIMFP